MMKHMPEILLSFILPWRLHYIYEIYVNYILCYIYNTIYESLHRLKLI